MNKLLCEHERVGSSNCYHQVRNKRNLDRDPDMLEVGGKEGMKYRHKRAKGVGWKSFGENLNPLYGWIRKQINRPWDKAYSELCTTFDMRNTINQHILVHLFERIEINTVWLDGKVCWLDEGFGPGWHGRKEGKHADYEARWRPIEENRYAHFYVDPRTGIVRENKKRKTWNQEKRERIAQAAIDNAKIFRRLDENTHLHLENGEWYVYTLCKLPEKKEFVTPPMMAYGSTPEQRAQQAIWWKGLTPEEQRENGELKLIRPPYKSVDKPEKNVDSRTEARWVGHRKPVSMETHYYATKNAASSQLKRRLGLD
jgi:hypothetical protein